MTPRDDLIRLGSAYGGWWVPSSEIVAGSTAYCAGAGEDITFDLELHDRGMNVVVFDPTPRAIAHVETSAPCSARFEFVPAGWWNENASLKFFAPRDESHVSHSAVNLQGTEAYFEAPVDRVANFMRGRGDKEIRLIKMDIEGAEFVVIDSLIRFGPLPQVLCIEFDQPWPLRRLHAAVSKLRDAGYVVNHIDALSFTLTLSA